MEDIKRRLSEVLTQQFPDSELEVVSSSADRIGGLLIWKGFEGQEQIERQRTLWNVLRRSLSKDEQLQVASLLTLTPEEMVVARQG
jgi:stress-induced morphogen